MTITVVLNNEAAEIVERQVSEGRYPDAESAVTAALTLLDDAMLDLSDLDAEAVRHMISDSDAQGGELSRADVSRHLDAAIGAARR